MTPPRSTADAAAPLHERLEAWAEALQPWNSRLSADLREAAAALRPPECEVKDLCVRLEALADWLDSNKPQSWVIPNFWSSRSTDLRTALAQLRRLPAVEAERDALIHDNGKLMEACVDIEAERDTLRAALQAMLEHSGVTDVGDEDKFEEDIAAEALAHRALAPAPAAEGE